MKLSVEKSYEIKVYVDIDINIKDYVEWLGSNKPYIDNLQEYIEEELEFDNNLIVKGSDIDLSYDIDSWDSVLFSRECQYENILYEAEKLQNELKAENQTLE